MQGRLAVLFFIFALTPLAAVGFLSIKSAEKTLLSMATSQLEQIAADKAFLLERWIGERKADVEVVAHSSILKSMDSRQIAAYLELVRNRYGEYGDISVLSVDGSLIHSTTGATSSAEGETWFSEAAQGRLYMSDISFNTQKGESVFRIAAPVLGPSGEVEGVVCAHVGTKTLLSVILQVALGETGECYLVNLEGTFLVHKEPQRILAENIAQSDSFKSIFQTQRNGITYIDYRGIEVLGASKRVKGTDWALVAEQDRDEALRGADDLRRYVLAALALSTLGALISAWLLSRYIVLPLRRLGEAAHDIARGKFETLSLETDRGDEMGLLHRAFDDMARQLRERQHRLEKQMVQKEEELKETDVRLKRTEEAALRSQQLASLGRLAAGVAHEIRTPLTSLKMFLETLEGDAEVSPEYEEDFQVAMNQVKRMEETIHRFLNFARPQDPIMTEMEVKDLVQDTLLMMGPRARQQETLVSTSISAALPAIRGDRKQLGEALLNLMVNALEAMGHHGELTIEAAPDTLETEGGASPCVRIDVRDTGPGIGEKNLSRIFDPFFTTRANGTGLGLSIAFSTLQGHGGTIKAVNLPGGGASFSLYIPLPGGTASQQAEAEI